MPTGLLTNYVTTAAEASRGAGIRIFRTAANRFLRGVALDEVGIVANFPTGPINTRVKPSTGPEFEKTFLGFNPNSNPTDITSVPFGRLSAVRAAAAAAAVASYTFPDADDDDSLVVTAKYAGGTYNQVTVTLTVADGVVSATVQMDGWPAVTYPAVQAANGTVTDPGDPWVTFSKASGATANAAAAAATNLAGGSNGTIAASDFTAALAALSGPSGPAIVLVAGPVGSDILDGVNLALQTFAAANEDKAVILLTKSGQTPAQAITYAGTYARDNVVYLWPQIERRVVGAGGASTITASGGTVFAALLQRLSPWQSPGFFGEGNANVQFIRDCGVIGMENETASASQRNDMVDGGVTPWFLYPGVGVMLGGDVMSTSSAEERLSIKGQRYKQYLESSLSRYLEGFLSLPLDLTLGDAQRLGKYSGNAVKNMRSFLDNEEAQGRITKGVNVADPSLTTPAYRLDPFALVTPEALAGGQWDIDVAVRDVPPLRVGVLHMGVSPAQQI
jgi:hypothetical protein